MLKLVVNADLAHVAHYLIKYSLNYYYDFMEYYVYKIYFLKGLLMLDRYIIPSAYGSK